MLILGLDTTAVTASVALFDGERVIASSSVHNKLTHSEKLLPMIDEILKNSGYAIDDVELIGVSRGPGSFTGVRIGIATAKGLAFYKNTKIVGTSSILALAENFRFTTFDKFSEPVILCPAMDARRNELYNALFLYDGECIKRLTEDRPISLEELETELVKENKKVYINGDGAEKLYNYLKEKNTPIDSVLASEIQLRQNAVSVAKLAYQSYLKNEYQTASQITPLYLRTSQAERVNNKER